MVTSTPEAGSLGRHPAPRQLERATVAVLMGGRSSEREVSLASGAQVLAALSTPVGREDRRGPERVLPVELLAEGTWRIGTRILTPGQALEALAEVDLVFSALHGGEGENGALQGLLTVADVAFTGSGVVASALAMDKAFTRILAAEAGLRVAEGLCLAKRERLDPADSRLEALVKGGCVVKPRRGGSSVGCRLVLRPAELEPALAAAFDEGGDVLVEALIRGTEASVCVLESPTGELVMPPPIEIRPRHAFFDYHDKYSADGALELCPPKSLGADVVEILQRDAGRVHSALGCSGYSRADFIVPEGGGRPVFLETNTLPGMTSRSLVPLAAAAIGIDYRTLCLWIAERGLAQAGRRTEG